VSENQWAVFFRDGKALTPSPRAPHAHDREHPAPDAPHRPAVRGTSPSAPTSITSRRRFSPE
jgi:hypothetical protein